MHLIGRKREIAVCERLLQSEEPEFLALYGRRRVGKTFLVREYFKKHLVFELTGTKDASLGGQLTNFHQALHRASRKRRTLPASWQEAFQQLEGYLDAHSSRGKRVIFLDELPWLAGPRSGFLAALDHFWNARLSRDPRNILIICGSAAAWMISKVIEQKGGLHNRVTARLRLEPFTLAESSRFLESRRVRLTHYDQLILAMVMGGVPHYLKEARPGRSAAEIVDDCCFGSTGLLKDEFCRLYASLFEYPERHMALVRELARHPHGLVRSDLTATYGSGGRLTETLSELADTGFISIHEPFEKKKKDSLYRLADPYSLFYLKWIEGHRQSGGGTFLKKLQGPGWRAWSGYALESLAAKHIPQIKQAMGIAAVDAEHGSWIHRADATWSQGAQVDLLLDRADNTINLFEIKFSQGLFTIDKDYARVLRNKLETFRAVTGTRKNLFLTFLTTHGITPNAYATELVHQSVKAECLFAGES